MRQLLAIVFIILSHFSCSFSHAATYIIDFSTPERYVSSLNVIRRALGDPINSPYVNDVLQLRSRSREPVDGVEIRIRGTQEYDNTPPPDPSQPDPSQPDITFILNPSDLYIAGFVAPGPNSVGRIFHRFREYSPGTNANGIPNLVVNANATSVVTINVAVQYSIIASIAGVLSDRTNLSINRHSITSGYTSLMLRNVNSTLLDSGEANAILIYATIISEALRYRNIQGIFAGGALGVSGGTFRLNAQQSALTIRWSRLSGSVRALTNANTTVAATGVRPIPISDLRTTFGMLACTNNASLERIHSTIFDVCEADRPINIGGAIWDMISVALILGS